MKNKYLENERMSIMLFLIVFVFYSIIYMSKNCFSAAMVLLVNEGVLTKSQTGTIAAVFYLFYAPFQIVGGFAADKYSPYKLLLVGFLGATIANIFVTYSNNYTLILIVWALNGVIQFGIWPAIFRMVGMCLAPAHRKNGVFYIAFTTQAGLISSYVVAGAVSNSHQIFVFTSVMLAVITVLWAVLGKFFDKHMVLDEEFVRLQEERKLKAENGVKHSFGENFVKSGLVFVTLATALTAMFSLGIQTITPTMLNESYDDLSPSLASFLNIVPIIVAFVGRFIVKFFCRKKSFNECLAMSLVTMVLIPITAVLLLMGRINVGYIVTIISLIGLTSSVSGVFSNPYLVSRFLATGRGATVVGIINCMSAMGIVLTNYICPRVAEGYGWNAVIVLYIVIAAVASILLFVAHFPWKKFIKDPKYQ